MDPISVKKGEQCGGEAKNVIEGAAPGSLFLSSRWLETSATRGVLFFLTGGVCVLQKKG